MKNGEPLWSYMGIHEIETFTSDQVLEKIAYDNSSNPIELGIAGNECLNILMDQGYLAKIKQSFMHQIISEANDCGALRAAQSGLALSDAEASIVSPFTSKSKSIQSVVDLIKEGRASLHTSFAVYKFLIYYGQIFTMVKLICFYYGVIMCQMDYLFIDAAAVITLGYTMTLSSTNSKLEKIRPTSSLIGKINLASSIGCYAITFLGLITTLLITIHDKDYLAWPAEYANGADWWLLGDNWETTALYINLV
eukprot:Awhi_evm2s2916